MENDHEPTDAPAVATVPPLPAIPRDRHSRDWDNDWEDRRPRHRPPPPVHRSHWPRAEGVLPRAKVRLVCFVVLTLSLFASGVLMILAVWDAARSDVAWKAVATLAIVAALAGGFTLLNELFGPPRAQPEEATGSPGG